MDKIFCGSGREIETKFGKLLKLSFSSKDIDTLKSNLNEKGWINLVVKEKREKQEGKNTHYLEVDTYQPQEKKPMTYRDMAKKTIEKSFGDSIEYVPF